MDKEELLHKLGARLVKDVSSRRKDWVHLVIVAHFGEGAYEVTGFSYDKKGQPEPAAPRDSGVLEFFEKLRNAMAKADKKPPWCTSLIRIDRATGEMTAEFEYEDAERWTITFENHKKRAEELRPSPK
jgi:hypothetical protein